MHSFAKHRLCATLPPNVVLHRHMGSATIEGRVEMGGKVLINIQTFMDGHKPPDG